MSTSTKPRCLPSRCLRAITSFSPATISGELTRNTFHRVPVVISVFLFRYARKGSHRASEYGKSLHFIGRCATVEQWWSLYCHLLRPTELKPYRKLHLFKSGIKPMWEDPENIRGGKWILRLRKNKVNRAWENVCMAMLGEQFLVGPEICGIVLSTQYPEDLLSVWNRTATDVGSTNRIRDVLKRILNLPANFPIEYKPHSDSLK